MSSRLPSLPDLLSMAAPRWTPSSVDRPTAGAPVAGTDPEPLVGSTRTAVTQRTLFCRDADHDACRDAGGTIRVPTGPVTRRLVPCRCTCHLPSPR